MAASGPDADVVVVVVAHDGARWLPRTLAGLAAQTVRTRSVVGADTGSTDGSHALLAAACTTTVRLSATTGYPEAVHAAVGAAPGSRWIWLLHDDSAPAPTALQELLAQADADPSAVLLGCKAQDWDDPRILVEVGLTVDAGGHVDRGLDLDEHDQGQHDAVRPVLAVGTAGALIRRDVWDDLGGLDPALPLFRDDVDLGWSVNAAGGRVVVVPRAVVTHVRAASTGARTPGALAGRPAGAVDRRHALFVQIAHASAARLPVLLVLLVGSVLGRAGGLLLTRQVRGARDELAAGLAVVLRPGALLRARRRRARRRNVPASVLRPLFASRRARLRSRAQAGTDWLTGGAAAPSTPLTEPVSDELPPEPDPVLRRPAVLFALGVLVVALLAERALLPGTGALLLGGRLLPAPAGAADLWRAVGTDGGPPVLALLAALATLLLGSAVAAVDVVLLLGVPLAAGSAYLASARLVRSTAVRAWGSATWALLPVMTGAVAAGRLDAVVAQVLLPPLLLLGVRVIGRDPGRDGWRRPWRAGLLLAVLAAGTPLLWPLLVALLLLGVLGARSTAGAPLRGGTRRRLLAAGVVALVPVVLLLPGWTAPVTDAATLLHGPWPTPGGLAGPVGGALVLLRPGGPGLPAALLTGGLLLAALAGTVRRDARRAAVLGWLVAVAGLLVAGLVVRLSADGARGWPGPALQVAGAGVLVAAAVAGDGVQGRLRRSAFGARQVLAVVLAGVAALTPVLLAGSWVVRGADGPVRRDAGQVLPAFAQAALVREPGARALVLQQRADGSVAFALVSGRGVRLGDRSGSAAERVFLTEVVADLATPRGSAAADALAVRAVTAVAVTGDDTGGLAAVLDGQPGLRRRSSGPVPLWDVVEPAARLQVLRPSVARVARDGTAGPSVALRRGAPALPVDGAVGPGPAGRLLVLAEPVAAGWTARLDGRALPRVTAWGGVQGFVLPAEGGRLEVSRDGTDRFRLAWQVLALLVVAVLAAPARRPRAGLVAAR